MIEFQNYHPDLPIFLSNLALTSLALAGPPVSLLRLGGAHRRFGGIGLDPWWLGARTSGHVRDHLVATTSNTCFTSFHTIRIHKDVLYRVELLVGNKRWKFSIALLSQARSRARCLSRSRSRYLSFLKSTGTAIGLRLRQNTMYQGHRQHH